MDVNISNVKNHIINNFLVPYYKFSSVSLINTVVADIKNRSWFPCEYDYASNSLIINIDENINVKINFIWSYYQSANSCMWILKNFE